jgi:hypothetical protein
MACDATPTNVKQLKFKAASEKIGAKASEQCFSMTVEVEDPFLGHSPSS